MLLINQKKFAKPDLTGRFSVSNEAELIRNHLRKIIESDRIIEATKHQVHNPIKTDTSMETRLYDAKAICKIKTAELAMYLSDDMRTRFFSQLDNLLDPDNWEEDDDPITIESFTTLLRMILFLHPSRRPGLGATQNGNIIAAWTNEKDRLTVECFPNDKIRWVLSRYIDDARESAAGDTQLIRLPEVLSPYNPERWFSNEAGKTKSPPL